MTLINGGLMKKFTYQQKRWIMATALLAVLAVNVSFNPHKEVGSANFASSATEDDEPAVEEDETQVYEGSYIKTHVENKKGFKIPVKYINNGENQVLAIVSKIDTEGRICKNCDPSLIQLSELENIENIDVLNKALLKKIDKPKTKLAEEDLIEEEDNEELAAVEESETPKKKTALEKIKISCERRSREDVLSCIKDEFINVLTTRSKAKKIESSEAQRFYKREIEDRLIRQIINAKAVSSVNYETFKETVNESAKIISDLIAAMPEKYESIRDSLVDAEQTILSFKARQYKKQQASLLTTKDYSSNFNYLKERTDILEDELTYMHDTLGLRTEQALDVAARKGILLPDVYYQYKEEIEKSNAAVLNYIAGRGPLLNGVTILPTVDLGNRIRASGRAGSLGTSSINSAISSRASSTLSSTQTGLVPVTVYATPDGRIVIPEDADNGRLAIPENTGISFGKVTPITPHALQMRTQIRGGDYRRQ